MRQTVLRAVPWLLAGSPLLWLLLLYSFVLRARVQLGRWPTPYHPDPKDLGFAFHHNAIWLGTAALPVLIIGAIAILLGRRAPGAKRWPLLLLVTLSTALLVAVARTDPGRYLEWFAD